jgi:hypothetical protein
LEQKMAYHGTPHIDSDQRIETERPLLEATEALVLETVELLSQSCPSEIPPEAARDDLLALKPHLREALEALEDIQRRRSLTDKERSQQRAFKMLVACRV